MGQTVETVLVGIGTIVLMLLVFVGAYFFSKFAAKQYQPRFGAAKNMEIIERMVVGKDQSLALVRVSGRVFLLAFTAQSVTKIEEMDSSLFPVDTEVQKTGENFMNFFTDAYKNLLNKKNEEKGDGIDE
jgi:flagellar biogenesis protein FliO